LHEHGSDVSPHPLVEDSDQEGSPPVRVDRTVGHRVASFRAGRVRRRHPLDDGDELEVAGAEVVPEEPVRLEGVALVRGVDRAQNVGLDDVTGEDLPPAPCPIEGWPVRLVDPVGVVQVSRAIQRQTDQPAVLGEKPSPLVGQQRSVRLQRVPHPLPGTPVTFGQLDCPAEKLQPHHRGLAALPSDGHLPVRLRRQVLAQECLLDIDRHAEATARIERRLSQVETVRAAQIADSTGRFGHDMERTSPEGGAD
jgi:hypothetical protein